MVTQEQAAEVWRHDTLRGAALEAAAAVCDKHASFLKNEAHAGGDWKHLMTRHEEAVYLASQIRRMIGARA